MFKSPAEKISAYLSDNGIKQNFLARKTGITTQTLSAKLNGATKLTSDDIEAICGALNKEPNDFLEARLPDGIECEAQ
jgi:DNA-binding Xre family transcriptional regulator